MEPSTNEAPPPNGAAPIHAANGVHGASHGAALGGSLGVDPRSAAASVSPNASPLRLALRKARVEEAERSEVIAELRGAETARLEMLEEELRPALADIPPDVDMFDVGITPGDRPRLFIDMIGFVEMAHDRRTYRFIQATRYGRVVIAESERIEPIVGAIVDYVARRLIEREKAIAGDATLEHAARAYAETKSEAEALQAKAKEARAKEAEAATSVSVPVAPAKRAGFFARSFAFLIEMLGSAALFALLAIGAWNGWHMLQAWLAAHH